MHRPSIYVPSRRVLRLISALILAALAAPCHGLTAAGGFCVPQGFVLVAFGANVLFYGLFYAGRAIARVLQGDSKEKEE